MKLVIVESPAKGKTIEKYLGSGWKVLASFGHVRDLPKSTLGVDVDHDFAPKYLIPAKARKNVNLLKKAVRDAEALYLATDYDREGEAIAWHIIQALGLEEEKTTNRKKKKEIHRITFHEITQEAIKKAFEHPRAIDMNLVDAQQARRVLDRLVGYILSPFLWKKVMKGLSAGRVQSVAVRLIVDREREIKNFKPQEYWTIVAMLFKKQDKKIKQQLIEAHLVEWRGRKLDKLAIKSQSEAQKIVDSLKNVTYQIESIEEKEMKRNPYAPFTTSTLQQEASNRLRFSAKRTMRLAQDLYEAGYITYMRTDSTNVAQSALQSVRQVIGEFGNQYLPPQIRVFKTKVKGAQEAHEAIRPTDPNRRVDDLKLPSEAHSKLYDLIWRRLIASQMAPAKIKRLTIKIKAKDAILQANGSQMVFDGFYKVWPTAFQEKLLPELKLQEILDPQELIPTQHFTEPPARYSEATLVKALEEHGIGRPSTYAPILSTIQARGYVRLENRKFYAEEIGMIVTDMLAKHFPNIVDINFTATMEDKLDRVASGKQDWHQLIRAFYEPFAKTVAEKSKSVDKQDISEDTDKICPKCGKPIVIKMGRFGRFYACAGFPDCRHTESIIESTGIQCPDCSEGKVVERRTRRGKIFWGCDRYPECKYATWHNPKKNQETPATK